MDDEKIRRGRFVRQALANAVKVIVEHVRCG